MKSLNKKAQIEKVITGVPIMLIIFFMLGIFIFLAFSLSHTKDLTKYQYFSASVMSENSILFRNITIDGKQKTIAEELISEFQGKSSGNGLKAALGELMIKDGDYTNKESCIYVGSGQYADDADVTSSGSNRADFSGLALKKDVNGNVTLQDYTTLVSRLSEVKLNVDNKRIGLVSYYGGCS
ncbi:MAG: hypothetical protein WCK29_03240 [archaeon]